MKIYFSNPTSFPILAATTQGISAKTSDNPIGQFGTGMKYVIAGVLRLGGTLSITTDGETFHFTTERTYVRDQPFDIVHVNGTPCGFTTALGKHWKPWQYIRELYSNCLDEGGTHGTEPIDDTTVIEVDCPALYTAYLDRHDFLLESRVPLYSMKGLEVHDIKPGKIFYRGILVGELEVPSRYSYNIHTEIALTEDRTFLSLWEVASRISSGIFASNHTELIKDIVKHRQGTFEDIYLSVPYTDVSDVTENILQELYKDPGADLAEWAYQYCARSFGRKMPESREMTGLEKAKLARASALLPLCGLDIPEDIRVPVDSHDHLYGFAIDSTVFLCERAFLEGIPQLAMTLIEETLHATHDLVDFSRAFQDKLLRTIISLHENLSGEPL